MYRQIWRVQYVSTLLAICHNANVYHRLTYCHFEANIVLSCTPLPFPTLIPCIGVGQKYVNILYWVQANILECNNFQILAFSQDTYFENMNILL